MKFILVLLTLIISISYAQEECDDNTPSLINNLSIPNCINKEDIKIEIKNIDSKKGRKKVSKLCSSCKDDFLKKYTPIKNQSTHLLQNIFLESSVKELEKAITESIVEIISLRTGLPTGTNFNSSINSCNTDNIINKVSSCNPIAKEYFLKSKFQNKIANEIASLISQTPSKKSALLIREDENKCNISDQDILRINMITLERVIKPELISKINSLPSDFFTKESFIVKLKEIAGNESTGIFNSHPVLRSLLKEPLKIKQLFSKLKDIPQKDLEESFIKELYSPKNGYGEILDNSIAQKCEESFRAFSDGICNDKFKSGDINIGNFNNANKLFYNKFDPEKDKFSHSEAIIQDNLAAFEFCTPSKNENGLKLSDQLKNIFNNPDSYYIDSPQKKYATEKYDNEIKAPRDLICNFITDHKKLGKSSITCGNPATAACLMAQAYQELHDNQSPESRLASSPDKNINSLLRAFVGQNGKSLDPETKKVLQKEGIIPMDNGKLANIPDIPERAPENFEKNFQNATTTSAQTTSQTRSISNSNQPTSSSMNSSNMNSSTAYNDQGSSNSSKSEMNQTDYNGKNEELNNRLSEINDEIKRRLGQMNRPNSKPLSESDVKKAVRDVYREKNQTLDPATENKIANSFMNQAEEETTQKATTINNSTNSSSSAKLGNIDNPNDVKRKAQELKALSGMQGAQAALGDQSKSNNQEDPEAAFMSKVKVEAPEEKVQLKLEEVLDAKFLKNDTDSQVLRTLVKNKRDFILEINNLSFKVLFDKESNSFKVAKSSGDPTKSDTLIPQLEKFLKKIL